MKLRKLWFSIISIVSVSTLLVSASCSSIIKKPETSRPITDPTTDQGTQTDNSYSLPLEFYSLDGFKTQKFDLNKDTKFNSLITDKTIKETITGYNVYYSSGKQEQRSSSNELVLKNESDKINKIVAIQKIDFKINKAYIANFDFNYTDIVTNKTDQVKSQDNEQFIIKKRIYSSNNRSIVSVNFAVPQNSYDGTSFTKWWYVNDLELNKLEKNSLITKIPDDSIETSDNWVISNSAIMLSESYRIHLKATSDDSSKISLIQPTGENNNYGMFSTMLGYLVDENFIYIKILRDAKNIKPGQSEQGYICLPIQSFLKNNSRFEDINYKSSKHILDLKNGKTYEWINRNLNIFNWNPSVNPPDAPLLKMDKKYVIVTPELALQDKLNEWYLPYANLAFKYLNELFKVIERRIDNKFIVRKLDDNSTDSSKVNYYFKDLHVSNQILNQIVVSNDYFRNRLIFCKDDSNEFEAYFAAAPTPLIKDKQGIEYMTWIDDPKEQTKILIKVEGDSQYNINRDFNQLTMNQKLVYQIDITNTIIHEYGHLLGLHHSVDSNVKESYGVKRNSRGSLMATRANTFGVGLEQTTEFSSISDMDFGHEFEGGIKSRQQAIDFWKTLPEFNRFGETYLVGYPLSKWIGYTVQDIQALWTVYNESHTIKKIRI
jgi:hypothetical protein